jgi:hypothetical protein
MSRMSPIERYLLNLDGRVSEDSMLYLDRELARRRLCEITGQDFEYDTGRWRRWIKQNPERVRDHLW